MSLTFEQLRTANVARCNAVFHTLRAWSPTDWATALGGESGEALDVVKKMRRIAQTPEQVGDCSNPESVAMLGLIEALGTELADVVTYADLLAARVGLDLGECVAMKFNDVSQKRGAFERLPCRANGVQFAVAMNGGPAHALRGLLDILDSGRATFQSREVAVEVGQATKAARDILQGEPLRITPALAKSLAERQSTVPVVTLLADLVRQVDASLGSGDGNLDDALKRARDGLAALGIGPGTESGPVANGSSDATPTTHALQRAEASGIDAGVEAGLGQAKPHTYTRTMQIRVDGLDALADAAQGEQIVSYIEQIARDVCDLVNPRRANVADPYLVNVQEVRDLLQNSILATAAAGYGLQHKATRVIQDELQAVDKALAAYTLDGLASIMGRANKVRRLAQQVHESQASKAAMKPATGG